MRSFSLFWLSGWFEIGGQHYSKSSWKCEVHEEEEISQCVNIFMDGKKRVKTICYNKMKLYISCTWGIHMHALCHLKLNDSITFLK